MERSRRGWIDPIEWRQSAFRQRRVEARPAADDDDVVAVAVELLGLFSDLFEERPRHLRWIVVGRQLNDSPPGFEKDRNHVQAARWRVQESVGDEGDAKRAAVARPHRAK
jgi:hypothetical protein